MRNFSAIAALVLTTLSAYAQYPTSITAYGAIGDGTTDNRTAFASALSSGHCVSLPEGAFLINNSAANGGGISVSGIPLCVVGLGPRKSRIIYSDYSQNGIVVSNAPSGLISGLDISYANVRSTCDPSLWTASTTSNCISHRNNARAVDIESSTNVTIKNTYIHDAPSAGLTLGDISDLFVSDTRVDRTWANGFYIVNVNRASLANIATRDVQDAGLEMTKYYDSASFTCNNINVSGYTSYGWGGVLVNSCSNVSVDGLVLSGGGELLSGKIRQPLQLHGRITSASLTP